MTDVGEVQDPLMEAYEKARAEVEKEDREWKLAHPHSGSFRLLLHAVHVNLALAGHLHMYKPVGTPPSTIW